MHDIMLHSVSVRARQCLRPLGLQHARRFSAPPCALLLYRSGRLSHDGGKSFDTRLRAIDAAWIQTEDAQSQNSAMVGVWGFGSSALGSSYTIFEKDGQLAFRQAASAMHPINVRGELNLAQGGWLAADLLSDSEGDVKRHGMIRLRSIDEKMESQFKAPESSEWDEVLIATRSLEQPCVIPDFGLAMDTVYVGEGFNGSTWRTIPASLSDGPLYSETKLTDGCLVQFFWVVPSKTSSFWPFWPREITEYFRWRDQHYYGLEPAQEDDSPDPGHQAFGLFLGRDGDHCIVRPVTMYSYDDRLSPQDQKPFEVGAGPLAQFNGTTETLQVPLDKVHAGVPDIFLPPTAIAALRANIARALPLAVTSVEFQTCGLEASQVDLEKLLVPDSSGSAGSRAAALSLQMSSVSLLVNGEVIIPVLIDPVTFKY